jgi:hypothetical protein
MKKIFWFKVFPLLIVIGVFFGLNRSSWQGDDLSILSMRNDKLEIINVSPERGMVNTYAVENMDLWIPNGMGWYPASRLGLIVKDDDDLARKVTFYNFGFWPKVISRNENWGDNRSLWSMLGPVGWLRFRLMSDDWLWKKDSLDMANLVEIMPRDMSNNKIIQADIKINVINASLKNGFGNMIADRLEWWGLTVTSVQTSEVEEKTKLFYDFKSKNGVTLKLLAKIIGAESVDSAENFQLVLGTDLEGVLKYSQTYVRSL